MSKKLHKNIIGVFDSGLGGLSIFKYFLKELPNYNYIYLGDNARLPYGEKSPETVYNYTKEAVDFLFEQGCALVIIACNTASAQALRRLQREYLPKYYPKRRILGMIRPVVEAVVLNNKLKSVGIIGTKSTINSNSYVTEIKKLNPNLKIYQQSAPLLVPLIEAGWLKKPETKMILKKYLRPLKLKQIDSLILACTHYSFLYRDIKGIMGKRINIPNSGEIVADSLKNYIKRHPELDLAVDKQAQTHFYTTDNPNNFKKIAEQYLAQRLVKVEKIKITEL